MLIRRIVRIVRIVEVDLGYNNVAPIKICLENGEILPNDVGRVKEIGVFYEESEMSVMKTVYKILNNKYVRMIYVLPDLTSASPVPVGTSVEVCDHIYPKWIGTDIGCGITLFEIDSEILDIKKYKEYAEKLQTTYQETHIGNGVIKKVIKDCDVKNEDFNDCLGSIGGGNHFAELVRVDYSGMGELDSNKLYLCVHSGSREYGVDIQTKIKDTLLHKDNSKSFIDMHDDAVRWAKANRILIAEKFSKVTGLHVGKIVCDVVHNLIEQNGDIYIHRKGSIPSNKGPALIPGSRGTSSYLVDGSLAQTPALPHGAGRILSRETAKDVFKDQTRKDMARTSIGSFVVSRNESLMRTEHPDCYKDIDNIMNMLKNEYGVRIISRLCPIITVKM